MHGRRSSQPGSSPRARSSCRRQDRHRRLQRLIPACAEQLAAMRSAMRVGMAHPRVRGAAGVAVLIPTANSGSSPRTRSRPSVQEHRGRVYRPVPARAEQTRQARRSGRANGAHPRVRGADVQYLCSPKNKYGPSPRARSGRLPLDRQAVGGRLIPACAERTLPMFRTISRVTAHPRVRGADSRPRSGPALSDGSSPRARSGLPASVWACALGRLIPACAERTLASAALGAMRFGSSPRARSGLSLGSWFLDLCGRIVCCQESVSEPESTDGLVGSTVWVWVAAGLVCLGGPVGVGAR